MFLFSSLSLSLSYQMFPSLNNMLIPLLTTINHLANLLSTCRSHTIYVAHLLSLVLRALALTSQNVGELPVENVPQMVLLTFDDSVNDLNKGLYTDLFEKGRVNPNGCPISGTFYVSHEWTDYSQVQNLYSGGHEMASHTVS